MSALEQAFVVGSGAYSDWSVIGVADSLEAAESLVLATYIGFDDRFSNVTASLRQTGETWEIITEYTYNERQCRSVYDVTAYPVERGHKE